MRMLMEFLLVVLILVAFLFVSWKLVLSRVPFIAVLFKKAAIEEDVSLADTVSKVDMKKADKASKKVDSFLRQ